MSVLEGKTVYWKLPRFHLGSCFIAMITASVLLGVNIRPKAFDENEFIDENECIDLQTFAENISAAYAVRGLSNISIRGWPMIMCLSFDVGHSRRRIWRPISITINCMTGLAILICISIGAEHGINRYYKDETMSVRKPVQDNNDDANAYCKCKKPFGPKDAGGPEH